MQFNNDTLLERYLLICRMQEDTAIYCNRLTAAIEAGSEDALLVAAWESALREENERARMLKHDRERLRNRLNEMGVKV